MLTSISWGQKLVEYQTLYAQEKYTQVAKEVDSLFKCCPTQLGGQVDDWQFLLANAQMKVGKFSEAKSHYESISYHNETYPLSYGICLLKNQLFELAFAQLNDYYLNHGEEYKAIYWLGECYYYMQKPKDALRVLQKAVDSFPDDPDAFYLMGIIHTEKGDYEKAFIYFQAAYDTRNTLLDAKFNMGLTKFYAQQLESAEEILSELALEKPLFFQKRWLYLEKYAIVYMMKKALASIGKKPSTMVMRSPRKIIKRFVSIKREVLNSRRRALSLFKIRSYNPKISCQLALILSSFDL